MIISVASGKGGTGKTTISTNLALSLDKVQLLDCDVEEPNSYIFIKPKIIRTKSVNIPIPKIDSSKCNLCGKCSEVCAFNAIAKTNNTMLVFSELCHGCGACSYFCPTKAITEINKKIGSIDIGSKNQLEFIQGRLDIAEPIAPPIIREIKKYINNQKTVIIDAPPGTSCPVITAVKGSDYCILVTEPTPFGLNDLSLAVEALKQLKIPHGVVINRSNLGDSKVEEYCSKEDIPILMKIPFSKQIASSYAQGVPIIELFPEYKIKFQTLYKKIQKEIIK